MMSNVLPNEVGETFIHAVVFVSYYLSVQGLVNMQIERLLFRLTCLSLIARAK
jgi:hypothetical protein